MITLFAGKFTEAHAHSVVRQLLTGMSKLHIAGIMHRDLKPENLLYASQDDDALVKIADFGLSLRTHRPHILLLCAAAI